MFTLFMFNVYVLCAYVLYIFTFTHVIFLPMRDFCMIHFQITHYILSKTNGLFYSIALPLYMPTALQLIRRTEGWVVFYGFRIGGIHKTIVFNYILQSTTIGHRQPCYSLISFS